VEAIPQTGGISIAVSAIDGIVNAKESRDLDRDGVSLGEIVAPPFSLIRSTSKMR
jgi:hypothetical protein